MIHAKAGFSLIELMVVIVIIGILATIAVPTYNPMQHRAKEGHVKAAVHALQLTTADYAVVHDAVYPADHTAFDPSMFPGGVYPTNPWTNAPMIIGPAGTFSQGNLGYSQVGGVYVIEGYGWDPTGGPNGDGVVIVVTNG